MFESRALLATLVLGLVACEKAPTEPPSTVPDAAEPATESEPQSEPAAEVVANVDAQPGDTTTCPYSGRTFVVKADHPRVEYEGKTYWICSEDAAAQVRADPGKYLDDFDG